MFVDLNVVTPYKHFSLFLDDWLIPNCLLAAHI